MKRFSRIVAVSAVSLMLLGIPPGAPASGQEESGLLGFSLGGTSTAISTIYNQPSFGIPADPTFEVRKVYSITQLDTGPSGRAMSSLAWIGDVAGNAPPTLIFDSFLFNPTQIEQLNELCLPVPAPPQQEEPGPQDGFRCTDPNQLNNLALGISPFKKFFGKALESSPPYPVRAEAFYPSGGTVNEDVGGGTGMRARATDKVMESSSTTGRAGIPTVISFGTLESSSFSSIEDDVAVSISRSRITDLDILGFVHVDSIMTIARATSDGVKAKTESTLQIGGLTIKDQNGVEQAKLTVDKTGLHFGDANQDPLGVLAEQVIDKYLKPQGLNLTVGGALGKIDGAVGSIGVQGLILSLNSGGMNTLLDQMPEAVRTALKNPSGAPVLGSLFGEGGVLSPTLAGFLATFFQGDQTIQFVFGNSSVSSAASPPLPAFVDEIPPLGPDLGGGILPPIDFGSGDPGLGGTPGTVTPGTLVATKPVGVLGVPASLLGLILLGGLLGSRYLRALADRMTTAKVVARCPLEDA
ncbi:MAG: choice-of-anchor P family protein [Actinomycetota bacterium]